MSGAFGIVGTMDGVRVTGSALDLATLVRSIPPEIRVKAGFDSGRTDCGGRSSMGQCLLPGSLLFYFCQLIPHVIMLVFLLVLVAIQEEIYLKFKWL